MRGIADRTLGRIALRRVPRAILLAAGCVCPLPASAENCGPVVALMQASQTARAPDIAVVTADGCSDARTDDGRIEQYCHWSFGYRAPAARQKFADLDAAILSCLDAAAQPDETGVNHPDSFAQRRYRAARADVSLSLKDKAAQSRSLVFLRMSPITGDAPPR